MLPDWTCFLPIIVAISLAFIFNKVILALLAAIGTGSLLLAFQASNNWYYLGLDQTIGALFPAVVYDYSHLSVLLFSLFITSMIHIGIQNKSLFSLSDRIAQFANTRKKTMFSAYILGLLIFFDDYANSLLVGGSMKSLFKKHNISKEKLAYIVDATAAPIASISLVSTWIGFELAEIENTLPQLSSYSSLPNNSYQLFINSLPYAFYPILTLFFILYIILTGKDFGPMKKFEKLALKKKDSLPIHNNKTNSAGASLSLALFPLLTFIIVTLFALVWTGKENSNPISDTPFIQQLSIYLGNSEANTAILIASFCALLVSFLCSRKLSVTFTQLSKWFWESTKKISPTLLVLVLAWLLSAILKQLELGEILSKYLHNSSFSIQLFPSLVFLVAALISFSTGSSWSTMGILYSIVVPIAAQLSSESGVFNEAIFYCSLASVLGGAVWGDHCSPVSDTTIISSLSADCKHINHVKSQLPYALLTGSFSILFCTIPVTFGINPFLLIFVSFIGIALTINALHGKKL